MLGTRGIWHNGWFANTVHAATPAGWSNFDKDRWELFHIESDRSQCHDLAAEQPGKLEELKQLWFDEAEKYNGLPLADLNILEMLAGGGPTWWSTARRSPTTRTPRRWASARRSNSAGSPSRCWPRSPSTAPAPRACSTSTAPGTAAMCCTCTTVGCTTSTTSWAKRSNRFRHRSRSRRAAMCWASATSAPAPSKAVTRHSVTSRCTSTRPSWRGGPGCAPIPAASGSRAAASSVGRNAGQPVSACYQAPFAFTGGTIAQVVVDVSGTPYIDTERELAAAFARD